MQYSPLPQTHNETEIAHNEMSITIENSEIEEIKDMNYVYCDLNTLFDILTIILSISDIITDIIILISFYLSGRMVFFIISLIILIVAHLCYAYIFVIRYDAQKTFMGILVFIIVLPFGAILSFIIYLTDNPESWFSVKLEQITKLNVTSNSIKYHFLDNNQSKITQWIFTKLSKHLGYIIEAGIESLPQSLLQIIAIVYYKEANYISIISIFLSMFSVMTKSLIFSQGIDIKTYIWSWLCIVVDFFGIFFILSWVFYANDDIFMPQFMNYFSIIGEIWIYKVLLSVAPCVVIGIASWFFYYLWDILYSGFTNNTLTKCEKMGNAFLVIFGSSFLVLVCGAIGFIAAETFCFSIIAFALWGIGTCRWTHYTKKNVNDAINGIIDFIAKTSVFNTSNDRILRILAVNYSIDSLKDYIHEIEIENDIKALHNVSYCDIHKNCGNKDKQRIAKFYPMIWDFIAYNSPHKDDWIDGMLCKSNNIKEKIKRFVILIAYLICCMLCVILFFAKILQILFPYLIIGFIYYYDGWNQIDLFQIIMLIIYIIFQLIVLILGIAVFRIHYFLWNIHPGHVQIELDEELSVIINCSNEWYETVKQYPIIEREIFELYGEDIGTIILDYIYKIEIVGNDDNDNEM